jgi:hypothetical protein
LKLSIVKGKALESTRWNDEWLAEGKMR